MELSNITEPDDCLNPLQSKKNKDQSQKAKNGIGFNREVTNMLKSIADGENIIFLKEEPSFNKKISNSGYKSKSIQLKMDHAFLIIDHKKEELLYVLSDGTTTYRNDRIKTKRMEGIDQCSLKDVIEKDLLQQYPQFKNYIITHINLLVFPTTLNTSLKQKELEEKRIVDFCVDVNYRLNNFCSNAEFHQIDAAMTIDEMKTIIQELSSRSDNYQFTQNAFSTAWKKTYDDFSHLPNRELTVSNARVFKEHLIYCLENRSKDYSQLELNQFAEDCKINDWKNSWNKKVKIEKIQNFIENNF